MLLVSDFFFKAIRLITSEQFSSFFFVLFKVATPFGTIIEIPWILIDARRPFEMTEVERY